MNIVILTGAGVSAESGIATFRASNGLWHEHRVEDVASPEGFKRNPILVHDFYNARRRQLLSESVKPNAAHIALVDLAKANHKVTLVTQNIDDLHERAGSQDVIHMHGELLKLRCSVCESISEWKKDSDCNTQCPSCHHSGAMRPHVVWFGEMPLCMDHIENRLYEADVFVSIGTSGNVYPAAGFVALAESFGAHTYNISLDPPAQAGHFHRHLYGKATEKVPILVELLKKCTNNDSILNNDIE